MCQIFDEARLAVLADAVSQVLSENFNLEVQVQVLYWVYKYRKYWKYWKYRPPTHQYQLPAQVLVVK